jgi:hypothetical protein
MSDADDLVAKIRAIADEVEGTATSVTERAQAAVDKAGQAVSKFKTALQSIMDNIAWIAGLPAVLGGGFGFLKSNADDTAATDWQIDQLTERVAELESSNNLLGGDTKNWSINLGDAPGGSMTAGLVFVVFGVLIVGALWWQQKRRRQ